MNSKSLVLAAAVLGSVAASAQMMPGQGVANQLSDGSHPQDVVFVQRGGGNAYGYRAYEMPIGITSLPWAAPNFESTVKGLRLNFGWGHHVGMYGFDTGVFGNCDRLGGIGINVLGNYASQAASGLQIGLVNVVEGPVGGIQIGLVNYAQHLEGLQIGLINFATTQWTLPIINFAW